MDAVETKCHQAVNRPTIKASASFVGLGVVSTNRYVRWEVEVDRVDVEVFRVAVALSAIQGPGDSGLCHCTLRLQSCGFAPHSKQPGMSSRQSRTDQNKLPEASISHLKSCLRLTRHTEQFSGGFVDVADTFRSASCIIKLSVESSCRFTGSLPSVSSPTALRLFNHFSAQRPDHRLQLARQAFFPIDHVHRDNIRCSSSGGGTQTRN